MRFTASLFIVFEQPMHYVKSMDTSYDNLTPDIARALLHIAADIKNSIGFRAAAFFLHRGIVNRWQFRFLLGTQDEAELELTERQLCCRRRINRQILHSFTAIELNAVLGVDLGEQLRSPENRALGTRYRAESAEFSAISEVAVST